jgi:hypothetical protein
MTFGGEMQEGIEFVDVEFFQSNVQTAKGNSSPLALAVKS